MSLREEPTSSSSENQTQGLRSRRLLSSLNYPDFRLLLVGTLFTQLGQWTMQVGKGWLVFELTGSPFQLGLVAFTQGCGMFLAAPVGGVLADRLDKRQLIMVSQTLMMLLSITIALIVITDVVRVWHLYFTAFGLGVGFAINGPSRHSMVHDIVGEEGLANAIALNGVTMNAMRVIGPSIGGVLIGIVGVEGTFVVQSASYAAAVISVVLMQRRGFRSSVSKRASMLASVIAGARYAATDPTLSRLLIIAFISSSLGMVYMHLLPAYVGDVLGLGGSELGFLMTAAGIGALIAAVCIALGGDFKGKGKLVLGSVTALGGLLILLGFSDWVAMAVPVMVGLGAVGSINLVMNNTLIQTNVENQYRGRVMSIYFQSFSLNPMAALVGGAVAEFIGLQASFILLGSVIAGSILYITVTSPEIRKL